MAPTTKETFFIIFIPYLSPYYCYRAIHLTFLISTVSYEYAQQYMDILSQLFIFETCIAVLK